MSVNLQSVIGFGTHKGKTIAAVMDESPSWLLWAHANIEWFKMSHFLVEMAQEKEAAQRCALASHWGLFDWGPSEGSDGEDEEEFYDGEIPF